MGCHCVNHIGRWRHRHVILVTAKTWWLVHSNVHYRLIYTTTSTTTATATATIACCNLAVQQCRDLSHAIEHSIAKCNNESIEPQWIIPIFGLRLLITVRHSSTDVCHSIFVTQVICFYFVFVFVNRTQLNSMHYVLQIISPRPSFNTIF